MKLSRWAKENGVSYKTAWRWFASGVFPEETKQLATGTILVVPRLKEKGRVAIYARVSSSGQKEHLESQIARVLLEANKRGLSVGEVFSEVGSGLNGNRKQLRRCLEDVTISIIIVEHRERLSRFGFAFIEAALSASGRKIIVIDDKEIDDDLVRDMTEVLTSFCARLYGRRGAKNKAQKAIAVLDYETDAGIKN